MRDRDVAIRDAAELAASRLFVDGADRLVLEMKDGPKLDGAGWAKRPCADRIEYALRETIPKPEAPAGVAELARALYSAHNGEPSDHWFDGGDGEPGLTDLGREMWMRVARFVMSYAAQVARRAAAHVASTVNQRAMVAHATEDDVDSAISAGLQVEAGGVMEASGDDCPDCHGAGGWHMCPGCQTEAPWESCGCTEAQGGE